MAKPSIPKGTRDFGPIEMGRRNYIFDTIKTSFKRYGFLPIETPSMENLSTLTGKYGDEGDKLIFKILDSGETHVRNLNKLRYHERIKFVVLRLVYEFIEEFVNQNDQNEDYKLVFEEKVKHWASCIRVEEEKALLAIKYTGEFGWENIVNDILRAKAIGKLEEWKNEIENEALLSIKNASNENMIVNSSFKVIGKLWDNGIDTVDKENSGVAFSEKALRYDLTVPFARFVVQHQNELTFPFKRYQIQNVWRADRPQKGRYREFHQCDADVVGSDSLLYEVELVQIFDEVLSNLNIPDFTIKVNNRKVLSGIAEICGESDKIIDITVAIDKLDKIGEEGVLKELVERGVNAEAIEKLKPLFALSGTFLEKVSQMKNMLAASEVGMKGLEELEFIVNTVNQLGLNKAKLEFEVTLARGLNYYTGAIFEVAANGVKIGSICGGGRYDDLTGVFGMPNMSGVGISFGADRIYDVLEELNLFPASTAIGTQVLFINFGNKEAAYCLPLLKDLRANNIAAEIYPDAAKMKKQMKFANDKKVPYVVLVGESEMEQNLITVKNMESGDQESLSIEEFIAQIA